jgi:2-oxoglutarate dehydrogenase complex dehydrogenase (E1) component-like enzyme
MPANYFHILRRQMLRNFRKPLVLAAPKIGLKHPRALSKLEDFQQGTSFSPIYTNHYGKKNEAKKVIICSGKVYFDISQKLEESKTHGLTVIRVEEIAPFPIKQIEAELKSHNSHST